MNIKSIFLLLVFVSSCIAVALFIKPKTKELSYVYEKSSKHDALKEEYSKQIEEEPENIELQEKYINTLEILNDDKHIPSSIEYYSKTKDPTVARKIIEYYKAKGEYEKAIQWLDILYKDHASNELLQELIDLTSFTKKMNKQKEYMIEKYENTQDTNILFDLFSMGEKKYSLTNLYELAKKDNLNDEEYIKTLKYLIFSKSFDNAKDLYSKKQLESLQLLENKDEYIYLNDVFKDFKQLKKIYKTLYTKTQNKEYFDKLTAIYLDEGDIDKYIQEHKNRYMKTNETQSLDEIIKFSYLNEEVLDFLEYLSIDALNKKDIKKIESILAYYIDLDEFDKIQSLTHRITTLNNDYDKFKELAIKTYLYLGQKQKAKALLLKYQPEKIDSSLIQATIQNNMNEQTLPYQMKALKNSQNEEAKAKLFKYRYKTLKLFTQETYKTFGKPTTFKKLNNYIEHFPKDKKNKHFYEFAKVSKDPQFIAQTAQYFLGINDYDKTIELSNKALSIYDNNTLALKNLATANLWTRNIKESKSYLQKLYKKDPKDIETNYFLAQIYQEQKENEKANKHYKYVVENIQKDSLENKRTYINAKTKITNPFETKEEFVKIIEESNNNEFIIADLTRHFYENRHYNQANKVLDTYKDEVEKSKILKKLKLQVLIQKKRFDEADELIAHIEKTYPKDKDLYVLYQDLGNAYDKVAYKHNALSAYTKSLELKQDNKNLQKQTIQLKKQLSHNFNSSFGVRNKIKQAHVEAVYVDKKYKVKARVDKYNTYYSPKVTVTNINETLSAGVGKDYINLKARNILNSNISIEGEKSIDTNSKSTINDRLIYNKLGISYASNYFDKFFYETSFEYFKYDEVNNDFDRKRAQLNIYYPFHKKYFLNFSYVYEKVQGSNTYGYEDLSNPTIAFGENNSFNKNIDYLYSVGMEYKDDEISPFANFNIEYKNKNINTALNNSISKDFLTNEYSYTSMLYFSYYFLD